MPDHRKVAQDLDQVLKAKLPRSTGTVGQLGQPDFAALHPLLPFVRLELIIPIPGLVKDNLRWSHGPSFQ
jgi:hypothetical protein